MVQSSSELFLKEGSDVIAAAATEPEKGDFWVSVDLIEAVKVLLVSVTFAFNFAFSRV